MLLQALLLSTLDDTVNLHVDGAYMGYAFCGNFTGAEEAAGQRVTYEGHTVLAACAVPTSSSLLAACLGCCLFGDEEEWPTHVPLHTLTALCALSFVQAKLKPGTCSPAMMVGYPYMKKKPRDFLTKLDKIKVQ